MEVHLHDVFNPNLYPFFKYAYAYLSHVVFHCTYIDDIYLDILPEVVVISVLRCGVPHGTSSLSNIYGEFNMVSLVYKCCFVYVLIILCFTFQVKLILVLEFLAVECLACLVHHLFLASCFILHRHDRRVIHKT
jgi:hypothetical protein